MNVLEARTVCSEALWLGGGRRAFEVLKAVQCGWRAENEGDPGGEESDEEGEADPSGLAGQAHAFDLYSKRNGKSLKKSIRYFILLFQNNCCGCSYGEPCERSEQWGEQVNETASSGRKKCCFDQRRADGDGERGRWIWEAVRMRSSQALLVDWPLAIRLKNGRPGSWLE